MIAASEPLEFVPHGRTVVAKHPGQIYGKGHNCSATEHSLLYKLTNFAIRDESLLGGKEEEREWWDVREVYYRGDEVLADIDEELTQPKDKFDYHSESFRPPSRLKNDFNISIKSELLGAKKADTDANSAGPSRGGSANSSSNMSKKFNLNSGSDQPKKKALNPKTDCYYEEELYVKGCTAVWSKGLISSPATKLSEAEQRETICCYTLENPIKHATFCNFYVNINNTMLIDALNSQIGDVKKNIKIEDTTEHLETNIMPSILLLDSKCMKVFASDGREYTASIPFQVKKVWPMKYGVLFEKDAPPVMHNSVLPTSFLRFNDSYNSSFSRLKTNFPFNMSAKLRAESMSVYDQDVPLPTCFSLTHPLDEVTPVLMKSSAHGLQYYNDGDLQIIFVSSNPSIILLYDWKLGTHSLWRLRKATRDECLTMCPNLNATTTMFSHSCDYIGSPMQSNRNVTSWATGLGSPMQSRRGFNTPTSRSRLNSPMANVFHQQGMSPHASIGQASSVSMMVNTIAQTPPSLPLYPDVCLDHIWTDNQTIRRDAIESESDLKAFLHTDLVGHDYLCFLVKVSGVSKLQILRLQKTHSHGNSSKTNLMVGTVSTTLAKDAVVLDHLKMMALIDEAGNIILQSGNSAVGKVHVGGVLARLIDSPYTSRSLPLFPRRSSLLPSRPDAPFDDSLHLLSPVPHAREHRRNLGPRALCSAGGSRLTLQVESGAMYRISLPSIAQSSLVARCVAAATAVLPKDITMQVIIKWYGVRNAPGTQDLTPDQEWAMFSDLVLALVGYDVTRVRCRPDDDHAEVASKKQRTSTDGSADDWEYLLDSKLHKAMGTPLSTLLHMPTIASESKKKYIKYEEEESPAQFNANSLLFPFVSQILFAFHLVYEETKLNILLCDDLKPLAKFLYRLSRDLKLASYVNHYWLDFPVDFNPDLSVSQMEAVLSKVSEPAYFSKDPPNIFSYINSMFQDVDVGYYPYLVGVNSTSRNLVEVLSIGCGRCGGVRAVCGRDSLAASTPRALRPDGPHGSPHSAQLLLLCQRGVKLRDVECLPPALALSVLGALCACKGAPDAGWAPDACRLAMREELAGGAAPEHCVEAQALEIQEKETAYSTTSAPAEEPAKSEDSDAITGMEHLNTKLLRLLYPTDHRMTEVFNILQSSIPVTISLPQRPEVSDHDFIEEQEKHLHAVSTRTMALPVGRGMVTLRTLPCGAHAHAKAPRLCVWGRAGSGTLSAPAELAQGLLWPSFHNGVAAGLALVPLQGIAIHSSWLVFNKPKSQGATDTSTEHAGFLLALGLNGHLRDMPFMNMYEYFVKCHEMTSVGLLLGLAATYRGSMDVQATKMMSIHLEPLLPPTSIELDIKQSVLVAALLGVGLLYQRTAHAHYAQVLLNEIGAAGRAEMERCVEREGYALAGGLALGMVMAACGDSAPPRLAHTLRTHMLGGDSEGSSCVNVEVRSPGATVALGLIYQRSNNQGIAAWLAPPTTHYHLDYVRPDLLMLRVIARGLILWDSIEASEEWIEQQVPDTIRPYCFIKPTEDNIDYEAMNQAYCNIIAGACFALGLRFAGSGDEDARDAVLAYCRLFLAVGGKSVAELAGRSTLEACLCVCLLAAGMIMAGRGDLAVLRLVRRLRVRVPVATLPSSTPPLTHGGQMGVHCAAGLLFLGGGRASLSTTPEAVAALLTAFFPKFPTHSEDNRYHLQAFRHLYVLAVEPRLFLPRDLDSGKLCYAHIQVVDLSGAVREMRAPCVVPELSALRELRVSDARYWPLCFQRGRNWPQLQNYLQQCGCVEVKQRAGFLPHADDPRGHRTLLARALTLGTSMWCVHTPHIQLFTNDERIRSFVKHYLSDSSSMSDVCASCLVSGRRRRGKADAGLPRRCLCRKYSRDEQQYIQGLSMVTYECVVKDILCALPVWTTFLTIIKNMKTEPNTQHTWQIKLLLSQLEHHARRALTNMTVDGQESNEPLISTEFTLAIKQKVCTIIDSWEPKLAPFLRTYLGLPGCRKLGQSDEHVKKTLASYLVYHDLTRGALTGVVDEGLGVVLGGLGGAALGAAAAVR